MSLVDEIASDQRRPGSSCSTCAFIASRSPDEQEEWRQVFRDRSFTTSSIWRAMKARGFGLTLNSPERHRTTEHA